MNELPLRRRSEWLGMSLIVGATSLELLVRENFHGMFTEVPSLIALWAGWLLLYALTMCIGLSPGWRAGQPMFMRIGQALMMAACAGALLSPQPWPAAPLWRLGTWIALAVAWCEVVRRLSAQSWRRLQWAASVAAALFVSSQPFLAAARAPQLSWPSWPQPQADRSQPPIKSVQLFLLLDELGAGAAGPIVAALERRHVMFRVRAMDSAGANTAQVVPAMFSGGNFENAKPCGFSSTCGSTDVLDFSKITASRNDVDVVGFYMPYCAIHGLRYCQRAVITAPLGEWRLWGCAALRRLRYFPFGVERPCAQAQRRKWKRLVDDVEGALWRAPTWTSGGFLYAHLPLPHPPGDGLSTSVQDDYVNNINAASRLIERMVDRLRAEKVDSFSLVIFSDHPLRPNVWCEDPTYIKQPCAVDGRILDSRVPLIAAGNVMPATDRIRSNKDIFSLSPAVDETDR